MDIGYWRWRLAEEWRLGLALLILTAMPVVLVLHRGDLFDRDGYVPTRATITAFANLPSSDYPVLRVVARTSDGLIGGEMVSDDRVAGCRVGDTIQAERKGVHLRLLPEPCRPGAH